MGIVRTLLVLAMAAPLLSGCALGWSRPDDGSGEFTEPAGEVAPPASSNTYSTVADGGTSSSSSTAKDGSTTATPAANGAPASDGGSDGSSNKTTDGGGAAATDAGGGTPDAQVIVGHWYQVNNQDCASFCPTRGQQNVASPEGHKCTSGEIIPASAIGVISYSANGCWPNCSAHGPANGRSDGNHCYGDNQNHDNDQTDRTVGCFCK